MLLPPQATNKVVKRPIGATSGIALPPMQPRQPSGGSPAVRWMAMPWRQSGCSGSAKLPSLSRPSWRSETVTLTVPIPRVG